MSSVGGAGASGDWGRGANIDPVHAQLIARTAITAVTVQQYYNKGLLDVFVADHKPPHPLHFNLCMACSSRIAHEANAESAFPITNMISDPRQVPLHQRVLVRVKSNRATYHPDVKTALMRCQQRFEVRFKGLEAAKVGQQSMHTIDRSSTPRYVVKCLCSPTCLIWQLFDKEGVRAAAK
jgi:hypothetical protein